ncbi:MAG: cache domain-containing protein [Elusimicrobiales bacterium]
MTNFNWTLDYIFFFYGLSFLLLSAVCFLLDREKEESRAWRWLALFGLAHGLNEWLDLLAFTFSDGRVFASARLLVMAVSFVFLLEFGRRFAAPAGRRNFSPWLYALLLPLAALGSYYGWGGLNGGARYALGLTGGLLACRAACRAAAGQTERLRRPLLLLGAALGLYALAAGAVVPASELLPARWLNQASFSALLGFPVQLLRGLLAALAAGSAWLYFIRRGAVDAKSASAGRKARIAWSLTAALALTLAGGWAATDALGRRAGKDLLRETENLKTILHNRLADAMLGTDQATAALAGSPWLPGALAGGGAADRGRAASVLDRYCLAHGFSVCYLMDLKGVTVTASNRDTPQSFVGKFYAFRPYFTEAAAGRQGHYLAVGVTTRERGYYASAPVRSAAGKIAGVVVIKKNLNFLGKELRMFPFSFLISPEGVIFLSSKPELLFRAFHPVQGNSREALLTSRQFGAVAFTPVFPRDIHNDSIVEFEGEKYHVSHTHILAPEASPRETPEHLANKGWSLITLNSTRPVLMARFAGILMVFTVCTLLLAFFIALSFSEGAREAAETLLTLKEEVKTLSGIVPICASCKKIRNDKGYWDKVETYVAARTEAKFSHGLCPGCVKKLYPDYAEDAPPDEKP